jgi:hypothetical protein
MVETCWNPINNGMFTTPNRLIHIIADNFGDTQLRLQGITMRQLSFLANRWWAPNLASFRWFCWLPSVPGQHGCYNQKTAPKKTPSWIQLVVSNISIVNPLELGFVACFFFFGVDMGWHLWIHHKYSSGCRWGTRITAVWSSTESFKNFSACWSRQIGQIGEIVPGETVKLSRVSFPYRLFTSVIKEQH